MNTYEMLRHVQRDISWRIGAAAREDDGRAVEVFVNLANAIVAAIAFHDERETSRMNEVSR